MSPYFFARTTEAAVHSRGSVRIRAFPLLTDPVTLPLLGTRGERDACGMAKTFELACVRVCFDVDRAKPLSEPHRCRHGLPGLAERRQCDTLLSPQVGKGCSL
jgi:hypothetical protein